jgi:hypothetical protein
MSMEQRKIEWQVQALEVTTIICNQTFDRQVDFTDEQSVREFIDHPTQTVDDVLHRREIGGVKRNETLVRRHAGRITGIDWIVAELVILYQVPDHINPETIDTLAQPKAHNVVHRTDDLGIASVEVGLLR